MARLKAIKPRVSAMPSRLGYAAGDEAARSRHRDATQPWRQWYKTARWQRLRWSILVRDLFTCQRCKKVEGNTRLLVADHKTPHRGDEALFWDAGNLQCLCKTCHDGVKQAEEQASLHQRGVWY